MQTVTSVLQYKTSDAKSQVFCNTKLVMQTVTSGLQYKTSDAKSQVVCNTKLVMLNAG